VDLDISSSDFSSSGDEENFLESVCLRLLKWEWNTYLSI
jgi:hypothetical protein